MFQTNAKQETIPTTCHAFLGHRSSQDHWGFSVAYEDLQPNSVNAKRDGWLSSLSHHSLKCTKAFRASIVTGASVLKDASAKTLSIASRNKSLLPIN